MRVFGYRAKIGQFCAVFGYYKTFTKNIDWLRGRVSMLSGSPFPSGVSLPVALPIGRGGGVSVGSVACRESRARSRRGSGGNPVIKSVFPTLWRVFFVKVFCGIFPPFRGGGYRILKLSFKMYYTGL